jgi:tagatose 6-phosphate kinase
MTDPATGVLCVTLNVALDITYEAGEVVPGEVNRVTHTHTHAGGKGVNVARLLTAWDRPASVLGLAGGPIGTAIAASLREAGIGHHLVPLAAESRRTVTVVSPGSSTGFYEAGPSVSAGEWDALRGTFETLLDTAGVVVLAGSLPPGVPEDGYRQLAAAARDRGVPVVLDAHGKPLLHVLDAAPAVVTPNETELAEAAGLPLPVPLDLAADAARQLVALGAQRAVATLGERGLVGVHGARAWSVSPPHVQGNPTGAGDAVVAVLADGLLTGEPWPALLRRAAATAAAAVRSPVAGVVDPADVADLEPHVEVQEL